MSTDQENTILKNDKHNSFLFFLGIHFFFYLSFFISLYALSTFNVQLISALLFLIVLQIPLKKSPTFTSYVAKHMHPSRAFNSFNIINDCKQEEQLTLKRCLFCFHPHSVYAMGLLCSINIPEEPAFYDMVCLASNFALNMPIMGGLFKLWGVGSASNQNVKQLMRQGKNIGLLPGGFQQATITSPDELRCFIKTRKGFIKYALEYNYTICPVIVMGQHQAFWTFEPLRDLRLLMNKIKVPGVLFWNKKSGVILPTDIEITIVKGKPMNYSSQIKGKEITPELIDRVHSEYTQEIERLYAKYKSLNGDKPLKLY